MYMYLYLHHEEDDIKVEGIDILTRYNILRNNIKKERVSIDTYLETISTTVS